jgi:hypothetical protein
VPPPKDLADTYTPLPIARKPQPIELSHIEMGTLVITLIQSGEKPDGQGLLTGIPI